MQSGLGHVMPAGITRIDHPVIAVSDMEAGRRAYERLGFMVPPLGSHLEWGTGNWCIMFPDDYLELRGIVDGSRYTHHLDEFLAERGEGMMGIAFGTRDADASHEEALASGLKPTAIKGLTRRFALPDGDVLPRFRIVYLSEADAPGLLTTVICGHLTPELIRRPEFLDHPNAVTGVVSVTSVVPDADAVLPSYERLLGPGCATLIRGGHRISLPEGASIEVLSGHAAAGQGLGTGTGPMPYMPSITLAVSDLDRTEAVLEANGVPHVRDDGSVRVDAVEACGVALRFEPE